MWQALNRTKIKPNTQLLWPLTFFNSLTMNTVLFSPQFGRNVGSVARLCVNFDSNLYIVRPTPVQFQTEQIQSTGLDYWKKLVDSNRVFWIENYKDMIKLINQQSNDVQPLIFSKQSKYGSHSLWSIFHQHSELNQWVRSTRQNSRWLIFGSETQGIDAISPLIFDCLHKPISVYIDQSPKSRSLNLSHSVSLGMGTIFGYDSAFS